MSDVREIVSRGDVKAFDRDGVVCIRGVFNVSVLCELGVAIETLIDLGGCHHL